MTIATEAKARRGFNAKQPRDRQGRWVDTGASLKNNLTGALGTVTKFNPGGAGREASFDVSLPGGERARWEASAVSVQQNADDSTPPGAPRSTLPAPPQQDTPAGRSRVADAIRQVYASQGGGVGDMTDQGVGDALRSAPATDQAQVLMEEATARAAEHARSLLGRYAAIEPDVTGTLEGMAGQFGGRMEGLDFRLKAEDSLTRKIRDKAMLSGKSQDEVAAKIGDALRYTMLLDEDRYTDGAAAALAAFQERGFTIVDQDNSWADGNVYQGLNTVIRNQDGLMFEVQFHTQKSFDTKMSTHLDYELARDPSASLEERVAAWKRMRDLQAEVPRPPGVERVGNLRVYEPPKTLRLGPSLRR